MRFCFHLYMRALAAAGTGHHHVPGLPAEPVPTPAPPGAADFEQADARAQMLGEQYRGAGVLMAGLGVWIVLCAVAPHALEAEHVAARWWGWAELGLMLAVVGLWQGLQRSGLRDRWVQARRLAESLRYAGLLGRIRALADTPPASPAAAALAQALRRELAVTLDAQITYNHDKQAHYARIEHGSARLGMLVFAGALAAAALHLFVHWPWLLFLTAVGPTLAGAVHGVNGFLRLSDLLDDHRDMALRLQDLRQQLARADHAALLHEAPPHETLLAVARASYRLLADRDIQWHAMASTINPKLG